LEKRSKRKVAGIEGGISDSKKQKKNKKKRRRVEEIKKQKNAGGRGSNEKHVEKGGS